MAVGAVSVVLVQREEGLDRADRCGGGRRGDAGHAGCGSSPACSFGGGSSSRFAQCCLAVVVALPCNWLAIELEKARREREIAADVTNFGGKVDWGEPSGPRWFRSLLGHDFFDNIKNVSFFGSQNADFGLERLNGLISLVELNLALSGLTDSGSISRDCPNSKS